MPFSAPLWSPLLLSAPLSGRSLPDPPCSSLILLVPWSRVEQRGADKSREDQRGVGRSREEKRGSSEAVHWCSPAGEFWFFFLMESFEAKATDCIFNVWNCVMVMDTGHRVFLGTWMWHFSWEETFDVNLLRKRNSFSLVLTRHLSVGDRFRSCTQALPGSPCWCSSYFKIKRYKFLLVCRGCYCVTNAQLIKCGI